MGREGRVYNRVEVNGWLLCIWVPCLHVGCLPLVGVVRVDIGSDSLKESGES